MAAHKRRTNMTGKAHPKFDPQKHRRKSIRLQGYDYSQAGAYFVTIVTYHRDSLFGEIVNKGMILNDFGKIADECWRAIPEHFPFVELGAFIIMPNHVHGIIVIHNDHGAGATNVSSLQRNPPCPMTNPPSRKQNRTSMVIWKSKNRDYKTG